MLPPSRPRRLRAENISLTLELEGGNHQLDVSLVYNSDGTLTELVFVGRGKIGQGMDMMLQNLGLKLSRAIQGRDPDSGAVL